MWRQCCFWIQFKYSKKQFGGSESAHHWKIKRLQEAGKWEKGFKFSQVSVLCLYHKGVALQTRMAGMTTCKQISLMKCLLVSCHYPACMRKRVMQSVCPSDVVVNTKMASSGHVGVWANRRCDQTSKWGKKCLTLLQIVDTRRDR